MRIKSAKDLIVYQKAYALAMEIFAMSKGFPAEEKCLEIGAMLGSMISASFVLKSSGLRPLTSDL
jgi:hypothetical protein